MVYVDYDYYKNEFYGTAIAEADFPGLAVKASQMVDYYTSGQAKTASGDDLTAVKNATCAFAEIIQDESRLTSATFSGDRASHVQSETVGSWSRSYGSAAATGTDLEMIASRKREALLMWLGGTGMLQATGYWGCSR